MYKTRILVVFISAIGLGLIGCNGGVSTDHDAGENDVDISEDGGDDLLDCDPEAGDETWVGQPSGKEYCCPSDELTCEVFDVDDDEATSSYNPETRILRFYIDTEQIEIESARFGYSIARGSGDLDGGNISSTLDGNMLEFDFSDIAINEDDELIQLTALEFYDVCGDVPWLDFGVFLDDESDSLQTDFDCSEPPF